MTKRVLVMPQFNEARTILPVLAEASRFVDTVVVVNDGSTDVSMALIGAWMRETRGEDKIHLLNLPKNQGMSGALLAGFCYVYRLMQQGQVHDDDLVVNIDADGQHDPTEIPGICKYLERTGSDIVLGLRDLGGYPPYKRIGNKGLSWWASLLSGFRYNDVECGFRVMRARVLKGLLKYFTGRRYGCAQEIGIITALLGYRIRNDFLTSIRYYRQGARLRDGIVNMTMGLVAFARTKLNLASNLDSLLERVLGESTLLTANDLERQLALTAPREPK